MTNVSLSGAFIQTSLQAPSLSQVQLIVFLDRSHGAALIEAQIVRQTAAGLGLEWQEFGSETIRALITGHRHARLRPPQRAADKPLRLKGGVRSR